MSPPTAATRRCLQEVAAELKAVDDAIAQANEARIKLRAAYKAPQKHDAELQAFEEESARTE